MYTVIQIHLHDNLFKASGFFFLMEKTHLKVNLMQFLQTNFSQL